jgi:hypothetical protein
MKKEIKFVAFELNSSLKMLRCREMNFYSQENVIKISNFRQSAYNNHLKVIKFLFHVDL